MAYSMISMRASLKNVGVSKGVNPFCWEAKRGEVNQQLASMFPFGRGQNFLNDLLEYCWLVYSKANRATGPQLIGRTGDLWVAAQLSAVGISDTNKQTLWDSYTKGNIQVMDKWSPTVNDCWVLGGVHRKADFELVSVRTLQNLWDFKMGFHIVTAREILGLVHFGYKLDTSKTPLRFLCKDFAAAQSATIEAYDAYMKEMQGKGPDSIRSVLVMDPRLQKEIQNFDKTTLKHVTPPR
jgi:hypothetical protein